MSRILRRPMFRGGPVSSYGTGITSGLADGGRVGFDNGGFLPNAGPLPMKLGAQLGQFNKVNRVAPFGRIIEEKEDVDFIPVGVGEEISTVSSTNEGEVINTTDEYITKDVGRSKGVVIKNPNYEPPTKTTTIKRKRGNGETTVTVPLNKADIEESKTVVTGSGNNPFKYEDSDIVEAFKQDEEQPVEPELDAKSIVAENKELFAELLGAKKARGQDISEMLLGFSGAEGSTVKEKFQNFTKAEAQRPGKFQKIDETAAGLAIQDFVAGKRSKEQIEKLMSVEDYRMKLKEGLTKVNPESDTWREALDKTVLKYGGKEGKTDSVGIIGETIKYFEKGKTVRRKDGINPKKKKKAFKDLGEGITIISYNDGTKEIIEKIGESYTNLTDKYPI